MKTWSKSQQAMNLYWQSLHLFNSNVCFFIKETQETWRCLNLQELMNVGYRQSCDVIPVREHTRITNEAAVYKPELPIQSLWLKPLGYAMQLLTSS